MSKQQETAAEQAAPTPGAGEVTVRGYRRSSPKGEKAADVAARNGGKLGPTIADKAKEARDAAAAEPADSAYMQLVGDVFDTTQAQAEAGFGKTEKRKGKADAKKEKPAKTAKPAAEPLPEEAVEDEEPEIEPETEADEREAVAGAEEDDDGEDAIALIEQNADLIQDASRAGMPLDQIMEELRDDPKELRRTVRLMQLLGKGKEASEPAAQPKAEEAKPEAKPAVGDKAALDAVKKVLREANFGEEEASAVGSAVMAAVQAAMPKPQSDGKRNAAIDGLLNELAEDLYRGQLAADFPWITTDSMWELVRASAPGEMKKMVAEGKHPSIKAALRAAAEGVSKPVKRAAASVKSAETRTSRIKGQPMGLGGHAETAKKGLKLSVGDKIQALAMAAVTGGEKGVLEAAKTFRR